MSDNKQTRREMLRNTALAGFGLSLFGIETKAAASDENVLSELIAGPAPVGKTMIGVPFERRDTVRGR